MGRAPNLRPATGLDLEKALERWSDPRDYQAMREHWDARYEVTVDPGVEPPPSVVAHREYASRRKPLEEALQARLATGELAASVLPQVRGAAVSREIVNPGMFHELIIRWDLGELIGLGLRMQALEIFDPRALPQNVWDVPLWYNETFGIISDRGDRRPPSGLFYHSARYRHVELRGMSFDLSVAQSRIVERLHRAMLQEDAWVSSRDLLKAANSNSEKVGQLFRGHTDPHWSELIESNRKGLYRLRTGEPD